MIYLDTSVALAHLFAEDRQPPEWLWQEPASSSRLLECEVWCRVRARGLAPSLGDAARDLLRHVSFVELSPFVLARAIDPFPLPVRTLDALHLASLEFLHGRGFAPRLASFDARMVRAARAMGMDVLELNEG